MQNKLGAQLYTVREFTQNLDGIKRSLEKVAAIGYPAIQISGFGPVDPYDVACVVKDHNLTVAATHMAWDQFLNSLDEVIEIHQLWGCKHAAIGGLPGEYYSLRGLEKFLAELKSISSTLAEAGIDFSYHNHNHELFKFEGETWLRRLYNNVDPGLLKAEIDVYWIQAGGGDPSEWIRFCSGREPLLHLKDMAVGPDREQRMAEVGEGNLNWRSILQAAIEAGVEWYLVEQDHCYGRDPFESLEISYKNLLDMVIIE